MKTRTQSGRPLRRNHRNLAAHDDWKVRKAAFNGQRENPLQQAWRAREQEEEDTAVKEFVNMA